MDNRNQDQDQKPPLDQSLEHYLMKSNSSAINVVLTHCFN